ncbi:hypothetical protein [Halomonas sp. CSM-2]|uniref:hypothetical protein n=1 Tax=Halomonas sp. CSM-2 TaxID=1975722 RepID=UPI00111BD8E8|nr:hypothetical protein [Halomonas sp. CSM-2]
MTQPSGIFSSVIPFVIALLVGVVLGSVVQTQLNLAAIQSMGVAIPPAVRINTTWQDLLSFAPLYALLFGVGFLVSQTSAVLLSRQLGGRYSIPLCGVAGIVGLWATLWLVNTLAPPPTLIAATRGAGGACCHTGDRGSGRYRFRGAASTCPRCQSPARFFRFRGVGRCRWFGHGIAWD